MLFVLRLRRARYIYAIYEFLFPEISLCDEPPLALFGDDETLGGQ